MKLQAPGNNSHVYNFSHPELAFTSKKFKVFDLNVFVAVDNHSGFFHWIKAMISAMKCSRSVTKFFCS